MDKLLADCFRVYALCVCGACVGASAFTLWSEPSMGIAALCGALVSSALGLVASCATLAPAEWKEIIAELRRKENQQS
mgnify:CR=1 FL=1